MQGFFPRADGYGLYYKDSHKWITEITWKPSIANSVSLSLVAENGKGGKTGNKHIMFPIRAKSLND